MKLRDYQEEAIAQAEGHFMFDTAPCCLALPTGAGKTVIASTLIKDLIESGRHVVFMMNLTSLVSQTAKTLESLNIKYNVLAASLNGAQHGPSANVTIAMQQTLSSRLDDMSTKGILPKCDVLIVDEMHISHDTATMNEIKSVLRPTNIYGLSATPIDEKGAKLKNVEIIETINTAELTASGYLTPAATYILNYSQKLDFSELGQGADFTDPEIDEKLNNSTYNREVVNGWKEVRKTHTIKTIVFVSTIDHAESLSSEFNSQGYSSAFYHSKMSAKERLNVMESFRNNSYEILISVASLMAGFDMPDIECGIMCRPTKRFRTYAQAVGRILRLHESKSKAIWIDAAQITTEHGLYDNPYDFKISDAIELKKYKLSRKEPYITYACKDNSNMVTRVTENSLMALKVRIEGDSSTEALIARYDAENDDIENLIKLAFKISDSIGQPNKIKNFHFVLETVKPYIDEGGSFKAIKTRARNIIKSGKKLVSLHYFPDWLKENQQW